MKVICISGKARAGKDTAAEVIKETMERRGISVLVTHYADLLKYICKTFFGWNGEKDDGGRKMLQYIGTDVVRKKNPNFWVDFVANIVTMFEQKWEYVIIPDARFPNELDRLREFGIEVIHIRVRRAAHQDELGSDLGAHQSENAMDGVEPDYWVFNHTLTEYKRQVNELTTYILARDLGCVQIHMDDEVNGGTTHECD